MKNKLISICIPTFNEAENIQRLYEELSKVAIKWEAKYAFEFVFSDNQSSDETWTLIEQLGKTDSRIRAIRFTKNIGFQESILANFKQCKGDAIIQIDADLQDPPEVINQFITEWENGFKVVYGVRKKREESPLLNTTRKIGYRFINALSDFEIPNDSGDFRLLDREIIEILVNMKLKDPYLRGTVASLGFSAKPVLYDRLARLGGESKFPLRKVFALGSKGLLGHSRVPLRLATYIGFAVLVGSFLLTIYYFLLKIFNSHLPQGLASIHILVLFGIGLNAFLLGIIGEYISRIYWILKGEPSYIISDKLNLG